MNQLSYEFLGRLRKLQLVSKGKRTGIHKGQRRSHRFGSSLEFSDFRTYQAGDDVRQIDWNIYGRTKRHYIKRYLDEQEMKVAIYVDCTSSMRAIPSKWILTKQLAAVLGYICLENEDRLMFIPIASSDVNSIIRKGSSYSKSTLYEIMNLDIKETTTSFANELRSKIRKGNHMSIIISDGMEDIHVYEQTLRLIAHQKTNVIFLQVLSNQELKPDLVGDAKLIDSEKNSEVNVSVTPKLLSAYHKRLNEHNSEVKRLCDSVGALYILVVDERSIEEVILKDFISSGILR